MYYFQQVLVNQESTANQTPVYQMLFIAIGNLLTMDQRIRSKQKWCLMKTQMEQIYMTTTLKWRKNTLPQCHQQVCVHPYIVMTSTSTMLIVDFIFQVHLFEVHACSLFHDMGQPLMCSLFIHIYSPRCFRGIGCC